MFFFSYWFCIAFLRDSNFITYDEKSMRPTVRRLVNILAVHIQVSMYLWLCSSAAKNLKQQLLLLLLLPLREIRWGLVCMCMFVFATLIFRFQLDVCIYMYTICNTHTHTHLSIYEYVCMFVSWLLARVKIKSCLSLCNYKCKY